MNMSNMLRFALGLANIPDDKVADLDKALPGFARLAALAKQAEPILTQAGPHLVAIEPHLVALQPIGIQLWPIVLKAWPDIVAVTPTVEEFIDLALKK